MLAVLIIAWAAKIAVSAGASVEEDLAGENVDPPAPIVNIQNKKGQVLFKENCAACHDIHKDLTGPALAGIEERVKDKQLLYTWIRNNASVLATGDKYFSDLFSRYNKTPMTPFPGLTDEDIDNILKYIQEVAKSQQPSIGAVTMR